MSKKEEKVQIIEELTEIIARCSIGILTDYRGLSTAELTVLRRRLEQSGVKYRVVKNTLARFAAERAGRAELASSFEGPVALAFGYGDIAEPARALLGYIRSEKSILSVKGGFIAGRLLTVGDVETLSALPSREILLARVMGGMQSPILALLTCLTAPIRGIIGGLQARIQQLEAEQNVTR